MYSPALVHGLTIVVLNLLVWQQAQIHKMFSFNQQNRSVVRGNVLMAECRTQTVPMTGDVIVQGGEPGLR